MDSSRLFDVPVERAGGDVGANDAARARLNAVARSLLLSDHLSLSESVSKSVFSLGVDAPLAKVEGGPLRARAIVQSMRPSS